MSNMTTSRCKYFKSFIMLINIKCTHFYYWFINREWVIIFKYFFVRREQIKSKNLFFPSFLVLNFYCVAHNQNTKTLSILFALEFMSWCSTFTLYPIDNWYHRSLCSSSYFFPMTQNIGLNGIEWNLTELKKLWIW